MKRNQVSHGMAPRDARGAAVSGAVDDARSRPALLTGIVERRAMAVAGPLALALAAMVVAAGVAGCGGERGDGGGVGQTSAIESFTSVAPASADTGTQPDSRRAQGPEGVPADSLPPDLVAEAVEGLVAPGGTVELTARASADVVEVFLWDGIGRKQAFAFDSSASVWRARYRVPLAISTDRLGVSVTAKNGLDLRSRVWVFLRIERESPAQSPEKQPEAEVAPTSGT